MADEAAILPSLLTYAGRLRECAAKRDAILDGTKIIGRAYEPGTTLEQLQRAAERLLESVESKAEGTEGPTAT